MPSFITIDRFRGEVPCYVLSLAAVLRADERAVTFLCLGAFKKKKKKFQDGGTDTLCKL